MSILHYNKLPRCMNYGHRKNSRCRPVNKTPYQATFHTFLMRSFFRAVNKYSIQIAWQVRHVSIYDELMTHAYRTNCEDKSLHWICIWNKKLKKWSEFPLDIIYTYIATMKFGTLFHYHPATTFFFSIKRDRHQIENEHEYGAAAFFI